jgi:hypothetical protein
MASNMATKKKKKTAAKQVKPAAKQAKPKQAKPKPKMAAAPEKKPRVFAYSFGSVYPLYVQKAEKKGRTKDEVDAVIQWLTGYSDEQLREVIDTKVDLEGFFARAPKLNPNVTLIKGVVCGVRIEEIDDPLMKKIRYMDKLVDELAAGKAMEKILRS